MTTTVKAGDTVLVHYAGRIENGEMFDSSEGQAPLKFTVGSGNIITGFDNAVLGMTQGEKKTVTIQPEDGYGQHQEANVVTIARGDSPEEQNVAVGMPVYLVDQDGENIPGIVTGVFDATLSVDINHPLAGKTLVFDIEIVDIMA